MKRAICLLLVAEIFNADSYSQIKQEYLLEKTIETIIDIPKKENLEFAGYMDNDILLCTEQSGFYQFYSLDENKYTINPVFPSIKIPTMPYLNYFSIMDSVIFYSRSLSNSSKDGYTQMYIRYNDRKETMLDSISVSDKKIHSSYSDNKEYLIVNSLNTMPEYYIPEQDDRFLLYDITKIQKDTINRIQIPCKYCSHGYLLGKKFFFTKSNERDDLWGGYAWTDIYLTSFGDVTDTVKIATRSNILTISPDGRHILIERQNLINSPRAILDTETRQYQILSGRDYRKYKFFFSYKKKKFAFVFNGKIIYIDFPEKYPFDALMKEDKDIIQLLKNSKYQNKPLE
jgi:hypothetical protein